MLKKKSVKILILILLFFAMFFAYKIFFYHEKPIEKTAVCEEPLDRFADALKEIKIKEYHKECTDAAEVIGRANQAWQEYIGMSKNETCTVLSKDKNFDKKIFVITETIRQANEFILEKKFAAACGQALAAKADLDELKKDSNIPDISTEIFDLFIQIDKLGAMKKKAEVMAILPDLKYKFTLLKQFYIDEEYQRLLSGMETQIGYLDKFLDGPDFQKAQVDLQALFWEMYYGY